MWRTTAGLLALLLTATPAGATTARLASHDDLVTQSELIVLGVPRAQESFWDAGRIRTRYRVVVEQVLLGETTPGAEIDVLTLGGVVDGIGQHVGGAAQLRLGQREALYLARGPAGLQPVAMWQGVFHVVDDGSGIPRLERPPVDVHIVGPADLTLPRDLGELHRAVDDAARRLGRAH